MAKQITITHGGNDYTLEYNRRAVCNLESRGSVLFTDDTEAKPMTAIFDMFRAAFYMHHKDVSEDTIADIFEEQEDVIGLGQDLSEMLKDTFERTAPKGEFNRKKNW